ncbi:hypothetical protein J7J84_06245 [bacterium]|nr:hypothetical protein [bacterium]
MRWVGVAWHTLAVFGDDITEPILSRLPETDDTYAAVFDFAVTSDGYVWYPLSRFDMTGNKLVRIDPMNVRVAPVVLALGDDSPSPFNVLADNQWLYVLSKYSLTESELMRISLNDLSHREKLTLPADGGGIFGVMAIGQTENTVSLGVRLFEAFALVDLDTFSLQGILNNSMLGGQIRFSGKLDTFVRMSGGAYLINAELPLELQEIQPPPPTEYVDRFGRFPSNGNFDLDTLGSLAVSLIHPGDKLAVLDLETNEWKYVHQLPKEVAGNVVNLGDDRFSLGGNLLYDLTTDEIIMPKGELFTECIQIKALPIKGPRTAAHSSKAD